MNQLRETTRFIYFKYLLDRNVSNLYGSLNCLCIIRWKIFYLKCMPLFVPNIRLHCVKSSHTT